MRDEPFVHVFSYLQLPVGEEHHDSFTGSVNLRRGYKNASNYPLATIKCLGYDIQKIATSVNNSRTLSIHMACVEKTSATTSISNTMSKSTEESYELNHEDRLASIENGTAKIAELKLLRKIDLWLLPLLTVSYMLQFLDKQPLNFASVMGLIQDLNLTGT